MDLYCHWIHLSSRLWLSYRILQRICAYGRRYRRNPNVGTSMENCHGRTCLDLWFIELRSTKKWFITTSLVWAIILGIFNLYHVITAVIYEASNLSEILVLLLLVIANAFLIKNITTWRKEQ